MISEWRFDTSGPFEKSFEEALLQIADSQPMVEMIKMKCNEIRKNPKANLRWFVDGRFVYIAKTGPVKSLNIDPLLVVYTLAEQDKLIQRVFVCKAFVGDDPQMVSMSSLGETLRRAIQRALRNAADGPVS